MRQLFVGVMSGTSQDGIDAVLARFDDGRFVEVLAHFTAQYPTARRARLLELSFESSPVSLSELAELDRCVADAFADAVIGVLQKSQTDAKSVVAVGAHGQTVFHDAEGIGNSIQLGDPSRIAARSGIPVVADFRRADIAKGGQGAPLLPIFHHALFARDGEPCAVLNLGGIANLTMIASRDTNKVIGFDCGPASCLMDEWVQRHQGAAYDEQGRWATSGQLDEELLQRCLAEPYFRMPPPKSTGRGLFNLAWLAAADPDLHKRPPVNVQRSLAELTVRTVVDDLRAYSPDAQRLWVCGGGSRNRFLMKRLVHVLEPANITVSPSDEIGLPAQWIEATAFAWLACRRLRNEPGNLPSVTGADREAVLGAIYSA